MPRRRACALTSRSPTPRSPSTPRRIRAPSTERVPLVSGGLLPVTRRFPPNPWLTLSLFVATLMTAWPQPHDGNLAFIVLGVTTLVSVRFRIGPLALIVLFAVGIELRYAEFAQGVSDVPQTTRVAINALLSGGNPYLVSSTPGVAPFPYGPLTLLWYLPMHDPRATEFVVSIALLAVLAVRGQPLGLALWAAAPLTVHLASDGSNDHSAALFLLVAIVVLERWPRAGAALVGVAAGFKVYALAWLPPILVWAGIGALVSGLVAFVAVWLPAVVLWGPMNILAAFQAAESVHRTPYYSLGEALARAKFIVIRSTLDTFRLIAGAATALALSPFARSHRGVVVAGIAIYLVTLYSGFWSTAAYLVSPMLLACWYLDNWVGPENPRIAWPTDPVGLVTEAVDRRCPTVDATRIGRP